MPYARLSGAEWLRLSVAGPPHAGESTSAASRMAWQAHNSALDCGVEVSPRQGFQHASMTTQSANRAGVGSAVAQSSAGRLCAYHA